MEMHSSSVSSRTHSHTRTNSSSSSASSILNSPTNGDPGQFLFNNFNSANLSTPPNYYDKTPSEAAALAAVKNQSHFHFPTSNKSSSSLHPSKHQQSQHQQKHQSTHKSAAALKNASAAANAAVFAAAKPAKESTSTLASKANKLFTRQKQASTAKLMSRSHSAINGSSLLANGLSSTSSGHSTSASMATGHAASTHHHLPSSISTTAVTSTPTSASSSSSARKRKIDLTVQTSIGLPQPSKSTLSEKSPLSRPSRELDRIASIAPSPGDSATSDLLGSHSKAHKPHNKHHLSFRTRKDSYGLSSSSSNSKLVSAEQGSIYSFHPSSPGVSISPVELRNLPREERDQVLDGSWNILRARIRQIFSGEEVRVPVEDLNNLLIMHISMATQNDATTAQDTLIQETRDVLRQGMTKIATNTIKKTKSTGSSPLVSSPLSKSGNTEKESIAISDQAVVDQLVNAWLCVFNQVTPYIEAVFLPLVTDLDSAINPRSMVLEAFRDIIVIPLIDCLEAIVSKPLQFDLPNSPGSITQTASRVLQCINILSLLQTDDENQTRIDQLALNLRNSWLNLPRVGKDRRGVIVPNVVSKA